MVTQTKRKMKVARRWAIHIPGEGYQDIRYTGDDEAAARVAWLRSAKRQRLPRGSRITTRRGS